MTTAIDSFSIILLGLLFPLLQLISLAALVLRRQSYSKRQATLKSCYWAILPAIVPWLTYGTFGLILLNFWHRSPNTHWAIVLWAGLAIANRIVLPITISLTLLPPYPPRVWLSTIYRLSAIGMAIVAHHLTQQVFPIAP
jgi:hypothetical protein